MIILYQNNILTKYIWDASQEQYSMQQLIEFVNEVGITTY